MSGPGWLRSVRRSEGAYGSFAVLGASLHVALFTGDVGDPSVHDVRVLSAALLVNLFARA